MLLYECSLPSVPNNTDFSQGISAGNLIFKFRFFWSTDIQEICDEYDLALKNRALADPWLSTDSVDIYREYDWLDYYSSIPHSTVTEVEEWLDEHKVIPSSLQGWEDSSLVVQEIYERCKEADSLQVMLKDYYERLVWNVEIECEGQQVSGVVRRGAWLNTQDATWRVRFMADSEIRRDNLEIVSIQLGVTDDAAV